MFKDSSTFCCTLKTVVCAIDASKYNLEDAEFDPDWH